MENSQKPVFLPDVKWGHLGDPDEYKDLKNRITHICNDVTDAGCIPEICIMDIVNTFRRFGYEVVKREMVSQD